MYALKTYQAHLITPLDSPGAMASWVLSCLLCLHLNFGCAFPRGCSSSHHHDQATGLGSAWVLHFGLAELALAQMGWALALAGTLHLGLMATCPKFLASKATCAIGWKATLGSGSMINCQRSWMKLDEALQKLSPCTVNLDQWNMRWEDSPLHLPPPPQPFQSMSLHIACPHVARWVHFLSIQLCLQNTGHSGRPSRASPQSSLPCVLSLSISVPGIVPPKKRIST